MVDITDPNISFEDFQRISAGDQIEDIHKALVTDIPVKTISESVFITEILPVITGEVTNADFPALVAGVAGNPFLELDIIDNQGNVLFRMPALLERNILSQDEASRRGSMHSMLVTLAQVRLQSPHRAANYLAHEFSGRGIATGKAALTSKLFNRWAEIFSRYGKSFNNAPVGKGGVATPVANPKTMEINISDGDLF